MPSVQRASKNSYQPTSRRKRVLNAGSGAASTRRLHQMFRREGWREIRLDIDPSVEPDLLCSVTDMGDLVPSQSFDAAWASHSLEHLHRHEVDAALSEFRRILRPDGFALVTSPDLEMVASMLIEHGPTYVAYTSPMGPITAQDMLFGHGDSIRRGMTFMTHNSGFTCESLGTSLLRAGFPMALGKRAGFDVWAVALMEEADKTAILSDLEAAGLDFFDRVE